MIDLFTKQEKIFLSFLLFAIVVGGGIKIYQSHSRMAMQVIQSEPADEIEKKIQAKAAQIDSLLQARPITFRKDKFSIDKGGLDSSSSAVVLANRNLSIEINSATVAELEQLPQIGPVLADRIVKHRNVYGEFKTIEDLTKVKGIGEKKFNQIKPYIYVK